MHERPTTLGSFEVLPSELTPQHSEWLAGEAILAMAMTLE